MNLASIDANLPGIKGDSDAEEAARFIQAFFQLPVSPCRSPRLYLMPRSICTKHSDQASKWKERTSHCWCLCERLGRKRLIEGNLHLVISLSQNYRHGKIHMLDLIEQGNAGLLLAVQSLKEHIPPSFSEYAIPFIEQALAEAKVSLPISPAHKR